MKKLKDISAKLFFILFALSIGIPSTIKAQISFKASAPNTVIMGEKFRLSFTLNENGTDIRLPEISGFDILFGPATTTSFSQQIINGKSSSETTITYTYTLLPQKEGSFTIAPATITVNGKQYKSNSVTIKVLPPDKSSHAKSQRGESSSSASTTNMRADDTFIKAIISKNSIYEQEGFTVTFRLYTVYNVTDFGQIEFPEFDGFMVEELDIPANQQLKIERYNNRNYYTADLKKSLLFPQRSGKIEIPSGKIEMVFSVPSGQEISTFFGTEEVMANVKKAMRTNPVSVDVKPLPADKPEGFSNATGSFDFESDVSTLQGKANEAITFTFHISGTGNLKLIKNPEIKFPSNFETYDPSVDNKFEVTAGGLSGTRKIEYLVIPRYEGEYDIPPVEFSYFDLSTHSYKTLKSPEYRLKIDKGDPGKSQARNYVDKQDVSVENDIRFLKTNRPQFFSRDNFFAGSSLFWMCYIVPTVLLFLFFMFNRKRARENANVALMRTKRANKVATKRLRSAGIYLKANDTNKFYDEVLKAVWGYFSDKLSIPVANLTKNNIEKELSLYGIDDRLIAKFMLILDKCEFARYAPGNDDTAMDKLYKDTIDAVGEMESKLKKS